MKDCAGVDAQNLQIFLSPLHPRIYKAHNFPFLWDFELINYLSKLGICSEIYQYLLL